MKEIPDPSAERSKPHSLEVFLFIALAIFVTEGQSFLDMEWYAETRQAWLEENIRMICVPVHETLSLLTQAIPPKHVSEHLISLTNKLREKNFGSGRNF